MGVPTCVRDVRSFLGMCSYYRRFLPTFSEDALPLVALTKKNAKFVWTPETQHAFEVLKAGLTTMLAYPDTNKPYVLYTDASDTCIGACLAQVCEDGEETLPEIKNERPIHFISHKLSDTQRRWPIVEKEAYAIYFALQKLNHYLHDAKFVVRTDHMPLRHLLESPMQNRKIQTWALSIEGYDCKIEYVAGKKNTCADFLSRLPGHENRDDSESGVEPEVDDRAFQINVINSNLFDPKEYASAPTPRRVVEENEEVIVSDPDIVRQQGEDGEIAALKDCLLKGNASKSEVRHFSIINEVVYYISDPEGEPTLRLYVPGSRRESVLRQYHEENGHVAAQKAFYTIKQKYYWPGLFKDILKKVTGCVPCQTRNLKAVKPPLQETDLPPYPFAKIGLDMAGPFPRTLSGNQYVITVVDWYSGWPEAFPVPDKGADNVAHVLLEEIFPRFGAPLEIVTDNGKENVNSRVRETLEALKVHHVKTSFYHPQRNARVERLHRTMNDMLSKKVEGDTKTWDLYLNQVLAAIRFNSSETTGYSPFYLLYNRDVVLPVDNVLRPRRKYNGEEHHQIALQEQYRAFLRMRKATEKAKKRQAKYADRQAKEVGFNVGDPVYYKRHQRRSKLECQWQPYYRIVEVKSPVTYIIGNQLTGVQLKAHAIHLRKAKIDQWSLPTDRHGRPIRKAQYVEPPSDSDSSSEEQASLRERSPKVSDRSHLQAVDSGSESDSDVPLARLVKRFEKQRSGSSSEDDIPLQELRHRLAAKSKGTNDSDSKLDTVLPEGNPGRPSVYSGTEMEVGAVVSHRKRVRPIKKAPAKGKVIKPVKELLFAITGLL